MSSATAPLGTYMNPMLRALFYYDEPGPVLKKLRQSIRESNRYLLIVPSAKLSWAYDSDLGMPFAQAFENDSYIASHVVLIPSDFKSSDKSRTMLTYSGRHIYLNRNFVQTHSGFKTQFQSPIMAEYMIRPSAYFLPADTQFLCCEVEYPLTGTPVFLDLIDRPDVDPKHSLFDGKILSPPESLGFELEKVKSDVNRLRSFKLLPRLYEQELSKLTKEFASLISNFYCEHVTTKDGLVELYNETVDAAISKFREIGSANINKIANETELSGTDLANMIGLHIESQLHQVLWEKTLDLCQEDDTRTLDLCWKVKDISIEQVGIPMSDIGTLFDLDELVFEAVKLFSSISIVPGVQSKTKVLLMVMQILSGGTPKPDMKESEALQRVSKCSVHYNAELKGDDNYTQLQKNISADVLLSLMLLVVIRSNTPCISATLFYIQNFSFDDVNLGQLGYALSTLEAVIYHLEENNTKMMSLSRSNSLLWSTVKNGTTKEAKDAIEGLQDDPDCISIVRSRSPSGVTILMHSVQEKKLDLLSYCLSMDCFDDKYILSDRDSVGSNLFVNALDTENKAVIEILLEKFQQQDKSIQQHYFSRLNNWKRSLGHYIFHAHWLLPQLGQFIDWEQKDNAGQSPLFAVCRCYDHPSYTELLDESLSSWEINHKKTSNKPLSLAYHIDPKDNSLLHVLKDKKIIQRLLKYDVDVNWPNEHGYTPLMFYSKFSKVGPIKVLLSDARLDLNLQGENGMNAIEVARDISNLNFLDSKLRNLGTGFILLTS